MTAYFYFERGRHSLRTLQDGSPSGKIEGGCLAALTGSPALFDSIAISLIKSG